MALDMGNLAEYVPHQRLGLTIYEIGILLHYYARCDDHEDLNRKPPIWSPTISEFMRLDLVEEGPEDLPGPKYRITARGRLYVEALRMVPLPEAVYMINWPTDPLCCKRNGPQD